MSPRARSLPPPTRRQRPRSDQPAEVDPRRTDEHVERERERRLEFLRATANHGAYCARLRQLGQHAAAAELEQHANYIGLRWLELAKKHLREASPILARVRPRMVYSRSYYAAYNASKAVRYIVTGAVSLKGDDHQRVSDLPDDFPNADVWSQTLTTLYEQPISLDLTLENPEAAESHLQAILASFLKAVGYDANSTVLPQKAFRRLAWANAGVPRDFLQMFARAVEHARRNKHSAVTLSDVNAAIGEFGQRKMDELSQDARNSAGELKELLTALEEYCLEQKKINAFLLRSEDSSERRLVHILSDLRLVHLISQSTTPDRAGESETFILILRELLEQLDGLFRALVLIDAFQQWAETARKL